MIFAYMHALVLRSLWLFVCVYLYAQTAVDAGDRWHMYVTNHGYFDHRKNPNTPN